MGTAQQSKRKWAGGRAAENPAEAQLAPGPDYVNRLAALGPRRGESRLGFECRLAAVRRARELWLDAWRLYNGDAQRAVKSLGLKGRSVFDYLARCGLSSAVLDQMVSERLPAW